MFDLRLYKTTNRPIDINKTLTNETVKRGQWQEQTSILEPVFKIQYDETLLKYTYAHIPKFNRYYFITNMQPVDGIYLYIYLKCDVLETYKDAILDSTQIIGRQENDFNTYLIDSNIPVNNGEQHDYVTFPVKHFITDSSGSDYVTQSDKIITVSVINDGNVIN